MKNAACQRLLFEQYAGRLMAVSLRYARDKAEAEDILQESYINIFSCINQFKGEGSFEGWLKKIVVNCAIRYVKKSRLKLVDPGKYETQQSPGEDFVIPNLSEMELMKLVHALPDGYRLVFNLYAIEGYSHNDIASMLGIDPSTSRTQLLKARRLLQEQILFIHKIPAAS
ncbi:MAG TPA: sigma-70 family RNA polymerase sigma factor [Panacibacter sp.]|nr:sigma-70 family RNA polymerase sigma factor [Panacibacter sp.]HNP44312.1 sigma-70 family RNA polymerase sigma factor [Panacibacter sp.]